MTDAARASAVDLVAWSLADPEDLAKVLADLEVGWYVNDERDGPLVTVERWITVVTPDDDEEKK